MKVWLAVVFVILVGAVLWFELQSEGRSIGQSVRDSSVLSAVVQRGGSGMLEAGDDRDGFLRVLAPTYERAKMSAHGIRSLLLHGNGENAKAVFLAAEHERNLMAEPRGNLISFIQELTQARSAFESARGRFELERSSWIRGDDKEKTEAAIAALKVPRPLAAAADITNRNLRTLAICFEAYAVDHHQYPDPKTLEKAFVPIYINAAGLRKAMVDGWETPIRISVSADQQHYKFASAGADRQFNERNWPASGASLEPDEDILYSDGRFTKWFGEVPPK